MFSPMFALKFAGYFCIIRSLTLAVISFYFLHEGLSDDYEDDDVLWLLLFLVYLLYSLSASCMILYGVQKVRRAIAKKTVKILTKFFLFFRKRKNISSGHSLIKYFVSFFTSSKLPSFYQSSWMTMTIWTSTRS